MARQGVGRVSPLFQHRPSSLLLVIAGSFPDMHHSSSGRRPVISATAAPLFLVMLSLGRRGGGVQENNYGNIKSIFDTTKN